MRSSIAIAAATAVLAGPTAATAAGTPPANLCSLNVKEPLKALPVGTACRPSKTAHVGSLTIEGANWGTTNHAVALQVYIHLPKSRFMQQIDKSGKKVALGGGGVGWEQTGATGVGLDAWVDGVGLIILLHQPLGANSAPYAAPVLTFAKAVAKQI